jgi:hypothetical protein
LGAWIGVEPIKTDNPIYNGSTRAKGETHKTMWEFHAHKKQLEYQKKVGQAGFEPTRVAPDLLK